MICDHNIRLYIHKVPKHLRPLPDVLFLTAQELRRPGPQRISGTNANGPCARAVKGAAPSSIVTAPDHVGGCRVCLKGRYLSEPMSPKDRRLHAAFRVRERLGQTKGGMLVRFPPKPKGMHWRIYENIRFARARELCFEICAQSHCFRQTSRSVALLRLCHGEQGYHLIN